MPLLRVATLNLWNDDRDRLQRLDLPADALQRARADLVALQEVRIGLDGSTDLDAARFLQRRTGHAHVLTRTHPDQPTEGLSFLSQFPLREREIAPAPRDLPALGVVVDVEGTTFAVTNVHLDWEHVTRREREIFAITAGITNDPAAAHEILLGDFNSTPDSSVYRFLSGQQSLDGHETVPWHDLAAEWAARTGSVPAPTLDKLRNPRWRDQPSLDVPMRLDWIMVGDGFAAGTTPPTLLETASLGETVTTTGLAASDHYGVVSTLGMPPSSSRPT